ncbi:MAG: hypothetical protein ACXAB4_08045 [Candidatus Hodarchaeales archaeon]|jgi:hypothetical protein
MSDPHTIGTMARVKHQQVYGMSPKDQRKDSGKFILKWTLTAIAGLILFFLLVDFLRIL